MICRQLALPLPPQDADAVADFLPAESNAAALAWIVAEADWPGGRLLLYGPEGCGKTHLLRLWARARAAVRIDGAALRGWSGLPETGGGVAIDDADLVADEAALLHLLNAAAEAGRPALLAAREPVAGWRLLLPDLRSRLRATAAVAVGAPEDALLRALLARLFADRQLAVPAVLQDWLLARLPRHGAALRDAVARLDRAALLAGRRVSRPLALDALPELRIEARMPPDDISASGGGGMPAPAGSLL